MSEMAASTILEEAVSREMPFLDAEAANEQILKLLRQVGQLENRNADLESGIKAVSAKCLWRQMGCCLLDCRGRAFCDARGLQAFSPTQFTALGGAA